MQQCGNYQLDRKIGGGGMGEVWVANHLHFDDRLVAVKFVRSDLDDDKRQSAESRFRTEVRMAGGIEHRNVVKALDAGVDADSGRFYLVMEHLEGQDVRSLLHTRGPLDVGAAAEIICQAARGLAAINAAGMVHRDIKPSNLFLSMDSQGPRVAILDLGLARSLLASDDDATDHTRTGEILGSFDYTSPEQLRNPRGVDIRADLYSLGCSFHELLTGNKPFDVETLGAKVEAHLTAAPPALSDAIPNSVRDIISRLLAKKPDDRFQSPQELIRDLEETADPAALRQLMTGQTGPGTETVVLPPSLFDTGTASRTELEDAGRKLKRGVILGGCAVLVLILAIVFWPDPKSEPEESKGRADAEHPRPPAPKPKAKPKVPVKKPAVEPGKWVSVLVEPVLFQSKGVVEGDTNEFRVKEKKLVIATKAGHVLWQLGTGPADFDLRLRVKSDWRGNVGVFLGKPTKKGLYQTINISTKNPGPAAFGFILRSAAAFPAGAEGLKVPSTFAMKHVPAPSGERTIEIEVRQGVLRQFRFGPTGNLLQYTLRPNGPFPIEAQGGFGVFVIGSNATVLEAAMRTPPR